MQKLVDSAPKVEPEEGKSALEATPAQPNEVKAEAAPAANGIVASDAGAAPSGAAQQGAGDGVKAEAGGDAAAPTQAAAASDEARQASASGADKAVRISVQRIAQDACADTSDVHMLSCCSSCKVHRWTMALF